MARETGPGARPDIKGFAELADQYAGYEALVGREKEARLVITERLRESQAALAAPVKVDTKALSKWFPGAKEILLEEGTRLTVRVGKEKTTCSVLELEHEAYCALVKVAAAEMARLLSEAEAKREAEAKPVLQGFAKLRGRKLSVFDWRNYELMLANTGGRARRVVIAPGRGSETFGPMDIGTLETTTIPLKGVAVAESRALMVRVTCEDEDGRGYSGEVELEPDSKAVKIFDLAGAKRTAGS